jgi:hypothetical protein
LGIWYISNLQLLYEAGFLLSCIPPTTRLDNLKKGMSERELSYHGLSLSLSNPKS